MARLLLPSHNMKHVRSIEWSGLDGSSDSIFAKLTKGQALHPSDIETISRSIFVVGPPLREPFTSLPDVLDIGPFVISNRCRDIIERAEPGLHSIVPVKLDLRDGRAPRLSHGVLSPSAPIDCIDIEKTTWGGRPGLAAARDSRWRVSGIDSVALKTAAVPQGRHLWTSPPGGYVNYFCSDDLADELKKQRITGWRLDKRVILD
jgi:hypothetical protein